MLINGRLFHRGRIVIAAGSKWIKKFVEEFHITPMGGHSGAFRTPKRVSDSYYWKGMKKTRFLAECGICQRQKYMATSPAGLLQPLSIPIAVWEDIAMDFITGLPQSKGCDVIIVVVDRFTKYGHFILLKHRLNCSPRKL